MLDIKIIQDADRAVVALKHPVTGALLGASVTLAGPEHPQRKSIEFSRQRKLRQAIQKTGKLELVDPEDDELDAIEKLASCTLDWDGIADGGTPLVYSKDAAIKLYGGQGMGWLRAQVYAALDERERFITA